MIGNYSYTNCDSLCIIEKELLYNISNNSGNNIYNTLYIYLIKQKKNILIK